MADLKNTMRNWVLASLLPPVLMGLVYFGFGSDLKYDDKALSLALLVAFWFSIPLSALLLLWGVFRYRRLARQQPGIDTPHSRLYVRIAKIVIAGVIFSIVFIYTYRWC